jgi:hypothetical protein
MKCVPILFLILLTLPGCNDDTPGTRFKKTADAARIEKEVTRRVEAAKLDASVRKSRLQTIRLISFVVLAGGAVGGLVWLRQSRASGQSSPGSLLPQNHPPLWTDHYPTHPGRVIDFPATPANPPQRHPPYRRSHTS